MTQMLALAGRLDLATKLLDGLRSWIPRMACSHLTSVREGHLTHLFWALPVQSPFSGTSTSRLDITLWSPSNGKQGHSWGREAQVPFLFLTKPSGEEAHANTSAWYWISLKSLPDASSTRPLWAMLCHTQPSAHNLLKFLRIGWHQWNSAWLWPFCSWSLHPSWCSQTTSSSVKGLPNSVTPPQPWSHRQLLRWEPWITSWSTSCCPLQVVRKRVCWRT